MTKMLRIALGGCAVAALALVGGTQAEAKSCKKVSGEGLGVVKEVVMATAEAGLQLNIAAQGLKPVGKVAYKCSVDTLPIVGPYACTATQRACK